MGSSGRRPSNDPHGPYLSLTGVALEVGYVAQTFVPELETFKRFYFGGHPDDPIILHRLELVKRAPPFEALTDSAIAERFDRELMESLVRWEFTVFTVVVDKAALAAQYPIAKPDPYDRALQLMVTRYAEWLTGLGATGDVFAESRGGNEDRRLKEAFRQLVDTARAIDLKSPLASGLTSRELKMKPKANNVGGLQLADLIAHPAMLAMLDLRAGEARRPDFGGRLMVLLEGTKYARSLSGNIEGTSRFWVP